LFKCEQVNNKWSCGAFCIVRVIENNSGMYHTDVGYGSAANMPTNTQAADKALKSAASDGMKRALRLFGEALGNSLYNKRYIKEVQAGYHRDRPMITKVDRQPGDGDDDNDDNDACDRVVVGEATPGSLSARIGNLR
jgi:DNA recombination protein Rad52